MKKALAILFASFIFFVSAFIPVAYAQMNNPHNNKLGIHVAVPSEEDLRDAASLINSSGGDWGYVTLVIEEKDRDKEKWQRIFDQMRELHLIPIVRLATSPIGDLWRKPEAKDAQTWVDFLGSLNWVVKSRDIVLFNEPNFNKEWGGQIDPQDYAHIAQVFSQKLKENNTDYFVMLAGFNATAPHDLPSYESEQTYLEKMTESLGGAKEVFKNIDGWASHSYETNTYIRELDFLRQMGLERELPVFITEAGWPHAEGLNYHGDFYSQENVSQNLLAYFNVILNDPRVVAITPFILNYQSEPFDHFSWRKQTGAKEFYPQFQATQNLVKTKGNPLQEQKLVLASVLPEKIITDSTYQIPLKIKNLGQAIWSKGEGYTLKFLKEPKNFEYFFSDITRLLPFEEETVWLYLKTKDEVGKFDRSLGIAKEGKIVSNLLPWTLMTMGPLKIQVKINAFSGKAANGSDFKILVYNQKEEMVFATTGLSVKDGRGELSEVNNLIVGDTYRLVVLKPYFLPRQTFLKVGEKDNRVSFRMMWPLDFNLDGRFSAEDLLTLIKNPQLIKNLL